MAQQQFTLVRPARREALPHVTERGEAFTLCGRRVLTTDRFSTWTREGGILKGLGAALRALIGTPESRDARRRLGSRTFCLTCAAALRKLQREGEAAA